MDVAISALFRTFCIFYTINKLIDKKDFQPCNFLSFLFLSVLFCSITFFQLFFAPFIPLLSIIIFILFYFCIYRFKLKLEYVTILVYLAHSFFYGINAISTMLTTIIAIPFYFIKVTPPYILLSLIAGIFSLALIYLLLKLKRIKHSTKLLANSKFVKLLIILCTVIIISKYFDSYYLKSSKFLLSLPVRFTTILLAFLLYAWWRRQITKSYIEKLRKLEIQSLYDELEEKTRLLQKLTADNEALARIIHRDNKIIPAMEDMVTNYLSGNDFTDIRQMKAYGNELANKLHEMAKDRKGILDNYEMASGKLKLTGRVSIDAVMAYMQKKAIANHITLECRHTPENIDYLLTKISEEDLTHLLSDLLENALIAMREQENGRLLVTFGKLQKEAYISVADTGSEFDLTTLHAFGIAPHTTHEDSGGSGIGLMDIWKIKKKYRATIQIQEYEKGKENFTKRILFSFNAKNHYVIQSYRHTEISNTQTRGDLYIIPIETQKKNGGKQYA